MTPEVTAPPDESDGICCVSDGCQHSPVPPFGLFTLARFRN